MPPMASLCGPDVSCDDFEIHSDKSTDVSYIGWAAALDFFLALYPVFVFWQLQMSIKRKIGVSCVMGLGVVWVPFLFLL